MDLFIGLMSGTSCDGIDAALINVKGKKVECLSSCYLPYTERLRTSLLSVIAGEALTARGFSTLDNQLAQVYAEAVDKLLSLTVFSAHQIQAIGLHGQTIDHRPPFNTWQLGSAAHVAVMTGIDVVADFRTKDVVLGGQGAPLAPALHRELFYRGQDVLVLNLGGIANISYITQDKVIGFDTGPASCLMDLWVDAHLHQSFDKAGQWAASGHVNEGLLQAFLQDPFFSQPPPKSTGRELFNQSWLSHHLQAFTEITASDVQATLLSLTVESVREAIEQHGMSASQLIVCGGGVHNTALFNALDNCMDCDVRSSADFGVDPDHVESILMAWLAAKYPEKLDLRSITGCSQPQEYGVLFRKS